MEAFDMVRVLKARQNAILEALPPELLSEFREIEATLRYIDEQLVKHGPGVKVDVGPRIQQLLEQPDSPLKAVRVPLAIRRIALQEYLARHGPASRADILLNTRMPPGTLSVLLNEPHVERGEDGLWRLKQP
jgi:hypothetical protein